MTATAGTGSESATRIKKEEYKLGKPKFKKKTASSFLSTQTRKKSNPSSTLRSIIKPKLSTNPAVHHSFAHDYQPKKITSITASKSKMRRSKQARETNKTELPRPTTKEVPTEANRPMTHHGYYSNVPQSTKSKYSKTISLY